MFSVSPLIAFTGAHPVVDGNWIVCDLCETGYQPVEGLPSNVYASTECYHHSAPCSPEYGQSECQAATEEVDVGCTCNASLGFSPKYAFQNCDCFTQDDPCSGCQFTGCPNGTIKNDRGESVWDFFICFLEQHVEEENKPKAACSQLFGDYIGRH